jgi:SAM-dependent methyltransferase
VMAGRHSGPDSGAAPMDYDAELRLLNEVLHRAYGIQRHDHVLDIGCGTGQTTREAARLAAEGRALGVDRSAEAIARARELARAERIRNATFEHADAEIHPFASKAFDVAISRFGTMFFHDPVAAFANIGRALRPAGRMVMMVWQGHEQNEWSLAIEEALGGSGDTPASEASDPFSLADPATTESILDAAGFADVAFIDVRRPIYFGRDVAAALEWVQGFTCTRGALVRLDPPAAERALGRLEKTLAAHAAGDGVWFDAQARIVKARRG